MILPRELGELGISIGTSVAFEYLVEHVNEAPSEIWINTRTVFRNLYTGLETKLRNTADIEDVKETFMSEITTIHNSIEMATGDRVKVVFYYATYEDIASIFKYAKFKQPRTEKQLRQYEFEQLTIQFMIDTAPNYIDFRKFKTAIKGKDARAWIVTHTPVDLLSKRFFADLTLLETHTAALKPFSQWHTKLTKGKGLFRMPFNELTIQVFGDGNNFFSGYPTKNKEEIVELANLRGWSPMTTRAKIREDLNYLKDPLLKDVLREMLEKRVK
jgi:hypothetical protein